MKSIETDKETSYNFSYGNQTSQIINKNRISILHQYYNVLKRLILHIILYNYRHIIIVIQLWCTSACVIFADEISQRSSDANNSFVLGSLLISPIFALFFAEIGNF